MNTRNYITRHNMGQCDKNVQMQIGSIYSFLQAQNPIQHNIQLDISNVFKRQMYASLEKSN